MKTKDLRTTAIIEAAGHYLTDQDGLFPDLYEAYMKLVEKCEEGYGNSMADCFVNVWENLEDDLTVKDLADLIETGADNIESLIKNSSGREFFEKIDWSELRNQKASLLAVIEYYEKNKVPFIPEHLTGILHLIDSIQDHAVDDLKIVDSIHVYDFEAEDDREES